MDIKRNLILTLIILFIIFTQASLVVCAAQDDSMTIHIAVNGNDSNNGSENDPIKTIEKAKSIINRAEIRFRNITVLIHGGIYTFSNGINISDTDWDCDIRKVTIKAAGDGEVVFSGSKYVDISKFNPITDESIRNSLPQSSVDYIGVVDLKEQGFTYDMVDFTSMLDVGASAFTLGVYLNGRQEKLAGYPNSGFLKIDNVLKPGGIRKPSGPPNCAEFSVSQSNILRWGNTKNAYIVGFLGQEWYGEWAKVGAIDIKKRTITLANQTEYGVATKHKWTIVNLPEEIDIPGEWYIDKENLLMYYYPRYPLKSDSDVLEISVLKDPIILLKNMKNLSIEGITVHYCKNDGIVLDNANDVQIKNCKVSDVAGCGIHILKANNTKIVGCDVYNTSDIGIFIDKGGDRNLLKPSNNIISNNHIYNTGKDAGGNGRGGINSGSYCVGNVIENNLLHGIKNYSYVFGGNDNIFQYNEIWNGNRETADSGPIYCGRHLNEYGNAMLFNYVHDCYNFENLNYGNHLCNSGDDWQSGTIIKNNILYVGKKTKTSATGTHARDNIIQYNTCIAAEAGLALDDRYRYIPDIRVSNNGTLSGLLDTLSKGAGLNPGFATTPVWLAKYPQISKIMDDLNANNGRFMTRDNIITDNVLVDAPLKIADPIMTKISVVERNLDINDYSIFVDPKNHDYRVTREAMKKYNLDPNVINEDNFTMDKIGIQTDVRKIEKPDMPFKQIYPRNGQTHLQRENLELVWESALYADQYDYVVATDAELKDVVQSGTTLYNTIQLNGLENGKSYYWKVKAKNISKQIGTEWESEGNPFVFTISNFDILQKDMLLEAIENAAKVKDTIKEGDNIGDYKAGTKKDMEDAIKEAQKVSEISSGNQSTIDNARKKLVNFVDAIGGYKYIGYSGISAKQGDWVITSPNKNNFQVSEKDGALSIDSEHGKLVAAYQKPVPSYEILKFKFKSALTPFSGFAIKQSRPDLFPYDSSGKSYLIVIKPDKFELQKYNPSAEKTGILSTMPNNGIIKPDQWYDITFGAVNVNGGVEVVLTVDGKSIFDYYDEANPVYSDGSFTVVPSYSGGLTEIAPADSVPEGIYTPPESLFIKNDENAESDFYDTSSKFYSEAGQWSESKGKGYKSDILRVSKGDQAVAKWEVQVPAGNYKVYYWHAGIENGDKNATVTFQTLGGISGDFNFDKKADFSKGEGGWKEIGSFTPLSPDSKIGVLNVIIKGSGEGSIPVSAIRFHKVKEDELNFAKIFYEGNKNLIIMKIGSSKVYNNIEEQTMEDTMPVIIDNMTYVPLRFIAENFGFDVKWDDTDNSITLKSKDYEIIFKTDSSTYTINGVQKELVRAPEVSNGRTLLPLRNIAEAIGKKVYWDNQYELILIGDNIIMNESSRNSYKGLLTTINDYFSKR